MRRSKCPWLTLVFASGCFGKPPSIDETESASDGSGDATSTSPTTTTGPGSSGDDPSATAADDTAGPTTGGDSTTGATADTGTGTPPAECGDGSREIGEVCFAETATWERSFDGEIVALALASIAGNAGDGGLLVVDAMDTRFFSWAWDGTSAAGPTVSNPYEMQGAAAFVLAGDFGAGVGEGILAATEAQIVRWSWDGIALLDNGPCVPPGTIAALGRIDDDPPLEMLWVPAEGDPGIVPWLDLAGAGWCDGSPMFGQMKGKPNGLAIGPFWPGANDDVALVLGTVVYVTELLSPSAFGSSTPVDFSAVPTALHAADLDGDGTPGELVIAGSPGVAAIMTADGATLSTPVAAGTVADLAVGDLDGDGDDDVVVVDATAPKPLFLLADGSGGFSVMSAPFAPGPSAAVDVADLNDDLALDVVVGSIDGSLRAFLATP